jgi:all-trans-retinol dehydrogenase (NAD+)
MFLRLYSYFILCFDIAFFVANTLLAMFQAVISFFNPPPKRDLTGEIALVAGAGRALGKELAILLGDVGALVICVDVDESCNEATANLINARRGKAFPFNCDLTKQDEVWAMVARVATEVGPITMLFHCAGLPSPRSLVEDSPPVEATLKLGVTSYFWLLDAILPTMKKTNRGHLVFLTSVAGLSSAKHQTPLSVCQFGVQGLFESVAEELRMTRHRDIHVSIAHIYPFIVSDDLESDIRQRIPSYFGTIKATDAARQILDGVRRNQMEISVPKYFLYLGNVLRMLPRKSTVLLRELLDTGVDFG